MKKSLLFMAGFSAVTLCAVAGQLREGYITWPGSTDLATYVKQWNGGAGTLTVNGAQWEDENFFVSRVKPKTRFYNNASQVNPNITQYDATTNPSGNDKRYVGWVPIGDCPPNGGLHTNALPSSNFDSEVFSMWSYMDHYGNWTSPWGWAPGAFADAAHKNGVAVSGVASVPFGSISANWSSAFSQFSTLNGTDVGKFLYYHGVDGLGYNSEWSGSAPRTYITPIHDGIASYMQDRNPIYENIWYGGTNDNGSISFDTGVHAGFANIFKNASIFLNYNWNNSTTISSSVAYAKTQNRNPFYIYAGMNQQGGEPKSGDNYPILKNYQYSIGIWGAHNYNMFWQGRTGEGSSLSAVQRCYLNTCERWFTNGKRNPAIKMEITTNRGHRALRDFAGMSSMMSARSVLNWNIKDEPFYTYFNLGNGTYFNLKGERKSNTSWYNIGIQDYLPTWRWWTAPTFLQHEVVEGTTKIAADFVWDDAYFGGSCLQVAGTTTEEYLHLFKTEFKMAANYVLRMRYKVLEGKGDLKLVASVKGDESTAVDVLTLTTVENSSDLREKSFDGWQTVEYKFTSKDCNKGTFKNEIAVLALQLKNAENLKVLLGELSIMPNTEFATPAAPELKKVRVLYNDMNGVDAKLIWNMANTKSIGEPVYNSDVQTSMFNIYAQEEGGEVQFLGATTSWAAIAFNAPNTDASKKVRYGVSAVGVAVDTESEITWSEYLDKGTYQPTESILVDKTTIKPNEVFTVYYTDPLHSASDFAIYNVAGTKVASGNGNRFTVENGLSEIGGYDVVVDEGTTKERRFPYFIQISSEEVGALPEIYTMAYNGDAINESSPAVSIELSDAVKLSYTGRSADGQASRAIRLNDGCIGGANSQFGIQGGQSFSIAGWFRYDDFPASQFPFVNITNKAGAWPNSNWGWCWSFVEPDGGIYMTFRGAQTDGGQPGELQYRFPTTKLQANCWTHIALVCEYKDGGFRAMLYVNGQLQPSTWQQWKSWNSGGVIHSGTTEDICPNQSHALASTDDLVFGGVAYQASGIDGIIDDMQVWNKALNADEIKVAMNEVNRNNVPSGLLAYWDFEDDCDPETFIFKSVGEDKTIDGYNYDQVELPGEGRTAKQPKAPFYISGCPFLTGTAFPVVTEAKWSDSGRMTEFNKEAVAGKTGGEEGAVDVKFTRDGDHVVTLKLENSYGSDSKDYPVFTINSLGAIGSVDVDDSALTAYTVDNVLFVEFAQDGDYNVEVYTTAGILAGQAQLNAVAGQSAQITLGTPGIYLVRVAEGGNVLRTIKVVSK